MKFYVLGTIAMVGIGMESSVALAQVQTSDVLFASHKKANFNTLVPIDINTDTHTQPLVSNPNQIHWSINASAYSPTQPIASFVDEWDAPLDKGDVAFAQGRAGVTVKPAQSRFSYGLDWRYDYLMAFNEPTAQVYWQYKNKLAPDKPQSYPLYLQAQHNERLGAHVGMDLPLPNIVGDWNVSTKAHIWQGRHAIDGKFSGNMLTQPLSAQGGGSIRDSLETANATLDYYYDKPALDEENLGWNPKSPHGYGYSFDVSLQGKLSDHTQLAIEGYDIVGRMHWKDIPSTRYDLDYEDSRRPPYILEGQLATDNEVQRIPWRVEAHLTHDLANQWQLGLHSQSNTYQNLYQLSAGYPLSRMNINQSNIPIMLTGLLEPQTHAVGLALDSPYGGVKLLTDSFKSEDAKRAEVSLYGQYQW